MTEGSADPRPARSPRTGRGRALTRIDAPERLAGIDLARGLAVIGMLAAHLLAIEPFSWGEPSTWIDVVDGRSSILFALLAGVSIGLTTGGTTPLRGRPLTAARWALARRAAALWVIGVLLILTAVPVYVILPAYAVLFILAIPLLSLRATTLLIAAAAGLVVMPFVQAGLDILPFWQSPASEPVALLIGWAYPFPLWSVYLVAGLAVGRLNLRDPLVAVLLLVGGAALAMVGYGVGGLLAPGADTPPATYLERVTSMLPHSGGLPEAVGSTGFVAAVLGLCLLACRGPVRWIALPLRATGSMPLTAYAAQILVWAVWALLVFGDTTDLIGFRELDPFWPITLVVVLGCTAWALLIGRGPLESLLARLR